MKSIKKVLITGATGFVGSHLARRLIKDGYEVHVFLRSTSNTWRIHDVLKKIKVHKVDLRDFAKVTQTLRTTKPAYIFHLATAGVYGGKHFPVLDLVETNLVGTVNLLAAVDDIDYQAFINTGSSGEYGLKDKPMKESDVCQPAHIYGVTKQAATLYSSVVAQNQSKPILTLRLFTPFGPFDDPSRLIAYAAVKFVKGEDLLLANPNAVRDFIYIEDVIDAYIACLNKAALYPGEVFNIGSGKQISVSEIVEKIKQLSGSQSSIKWNSQARRLGESPCWQADISKAKKLLGWLPHHTFADGLEKTINWFRGHGGYYE